MKYVRHYVMEAKADAVEDLQSSLVALRTAVLKCAGSLGTDMLQSMDRPAQFFFIEHWESKAHHTAALKALPPELLAPLKTLLAGPPTATNLQAATKD